MPSGKLRIKLEGEFSALELEDIIAELAKARAGLEPAVPTSPPSVLSEREVLVQDDALFDIRTLVDGGLRFWLRSEGFGWLAFTISKEKAEGLREFLTKKIGHSHTAH